MKSFTNTVEGTLVDRPNRFVVVVRTDDGAVVRAHCPNPGRLSEILVDDARLILERRAVSQAATDYTLVGAFYRGRVIPLYASRANDVAERLVLPSLFPDAEAVEREIRIGKSRIDFRVTGGEIEHIVEVKAVTLVDQGNALFPDAPSNRATRHLVELADAARRPEVRGHVLFCVMQRDARLFAPNVHTDPEFAEALRNYAEIVAYHAAVIETDRDGTARLLRNSLPVSLAPVRFVREDTGCYILELTVENRIEIQVGSLGTRVFEAGYYLYVGSGQRNLSARLARHRRRSKKTIRWHIDYLRAETGTPTTVRIYGLTDEARLARELRAVADGSIDGFGASDSPESSHLLYFSPRRGGKRLGALRLREVVEIVMRYQHIAAASAAE